MSLNGLDSPAVQDAHQAAIADAGGWFLLKYTSRDSVELLGQGRNGVSEARNAIMAYTETSPLYGLLMYRRRKILIKHIPEGTSRLLLARTAVHLSDILERYSPYETLLEISTGDALNDTALAASFQLHTASRPSPSPVPSSRLDEIREDGEDGGPVADLPLLSNNNKPASITNSQRYKAERRAEQLVRKKAERPDRSSSLLHAADSPLAPSSRVTTPLKTSVSQFLVRDESGHTSVTPLEPTFARELGVESRASNTSTRSADSPLAVYDDAADSASQTTTGASESTDATEMPSSPERTDRERNFDHQPKYSAVLARDSSMERRPSTSSKTASNDAGSAVDEDPYDLRKYDEWFKPKVKLGPRPVATSEKTKRPAVARVSALPANLKPSIKKQDLPRPNSSSAHSGKLSGASVAPPASVPPASVPFKPLPPPIPNVPEYKPRPVSRGSIKSTPSHKSIGMTPDKLRLMKAIELRKRQLRQSQDQQNVGPSASEVSEAAKISEIQKPPENVSIQEKPEQKSEDLVTTTECQPQSYKADSGIDLRCGRADKHGGTISEPLRLERPMMPVQSESGKYQLRQDVTETISSLPDEHQLPKHGAEYPLPDPTENTSADTTSSSESPAATERPVSAYQLGDEMVRIPTIVMADGSVPVTCSGDAQGSTATPVEINSRNENQSVSSESLEEHTSPRRQNSDLARRRRGFVEPLHVDVSTGNPDDFASDDDEFLEELQSATVQEAKPVMVSKSTVRRRPSAETVGSVRSVNITRINTTDRLTPEAPRRPVSPNSTISATTDIGESMSAVSRNVSSGISKRIQALSEVSGRPLTPEGLQPEQRERRPPSKARPTSYRRQSSNRGVSPVSTTSNESGPVWNVQHDPVTNRNSVSVTARIVRPNALEEGASRETGLQQSELMINHGGGVQSWNLPSPIDTSSSPSAVSSPALSPTLSYNSGEARQLHSGRRFGRHKQPSADNFSLSHSVQNMSTTSLMSNDENVAPKEGGRTSRFFKRMSNMNFGSSKNRINTQPGLGTKTAASISTESHNTIIPQKKLDRLSVATEKADMPPAVLVGDLNVQFPDSLLWKRRIVTVDESGNLQFAIAQAMEIHKGVALKHFPLQDLQQPYAPDVDIEELAHSLVLELRDGTSLQLACEDAMTQRQVLHLLKTYWKAWTATA